MRTYPVVAALMTAAVVVAGCSGASHAAAPTVRTPSVSPFTAPSVSPSAGVTTNAIERMPLALAMDRIRRTTARQTAVHYVDRSRMHGHRVVVTASAGRYGGRCVIRLQGGGRVALRLVEGHGFVKGDERGLAVIFGSDPVPARVIGQWYGGTSLAKSFSQILTVPGIAKYGLKTTKHTARIGRRRLGGRRVLEIRGVGTHPPETLAVSVVGQPLPVSLTSPRRSADQISFLRYGGFVQVTPPSRYLRTSG